MLPQFWPNQLFKFLGTIFFGSCLSFYSIAQSTPLATPDSVSYPGILQSLEKLIEIDQTKLIKKYELLIKNNKLINDTTKLSDIQLDVDWLNSVILHSSPSYMKLASTDKCRFYDSIINDLLKDYEGKINRLIISYVNSKGSRELGIIQKKDFLPLVVNKDCPQSNELIAQFQIKTLDETLKTVSFEPPSGMEQCQATHVNWLANPKSPYLCKIHEFIKEAKQGGGEKTDLAQRQAVTKLLEKKISQPDRDFLENICQHFDNEKLFCDEFLNVSFWNKVAAGSEKKIFLEDICAKEFKTESLSELQLKQCASKIKRENDLCLYPEGRSEALTPAPQCELISTALNHSKLRADYRDCPAGSDQQAITNMARILLNISGEETKPFSGPCSNLSTGVLFEFNKKFNNEEGWGLEACYRDEIENKDRCYKTIYGSYGELPESLTEIVANILKSIRGADRSLKCQMTDSDDYNPMSLTYKSGCFIVYERKSCFISECKVKVIYNDRQVNSIVFKGGVLMDYFPTTIINEKFSHHYILTRDYRRTGRSISSLNNIFSFFKQSPKGIIHGVGCAEDLLPTFFKARAFNQCSPLPFIIDGMIKNNEKTVFVIRSAIDSLQAPRLISWSMIFSAVKSYQRTHPLKFWTMYGLD